MRNRENRLKRVLDLAEQEERSEFVALGRIQKSVDEYVYRLEELETYRRDYSRKSSVGERLTPARWQDYQSFLNRINEAVALQKNQVQAGNEAREAHRQRWMLKRRRLDSIERAVDRYRRAEIIEDERKNQKVLDDVITSCSFSHFYSDD